MEKTLAVAKYLNELNLKKYGCNMSEMKMHKKALKVGNYSCKFNRFHVLLLQIGNRWVIF